MIAQKRVFDPKRVRIVATIAGYSTPVAKRNVSLILNGKTVQSKTIDVPAAGRAQVEFLGLDASYGFNRCEVRIDSADALADRRSLLFFGGARRSEEGPFCGRRPQAARAALLSSRP